MMNRFFFLLCVPAIALFGACSSSTSNTGTPTPTTDGGTEPEGGGMTDAPMGGTQCSKARDDLLLPIDKVSTGAVTVVSDTGGVKTLYVDATGGGFNTSSKSPRVYVALADGTKVSVTDKTAPMSTDWDLALRRSVIWTNSGDAGVGQGGALVVEKSFASVTAADATDSAIAAESFFDADCKAKTDPTGAPATTFSDWYEYDQATNMITGPRAVTYIVRGGTGKKYKVGIKAYDGAPDGGKGTASGAFIIQVAAL